MVFKKSRRFVGEPCSRGLGHLAAIQALLIDIVHTALASKCSVKTICLISEGYRTHRAVTGPMSFEKSRRFCRKIVLGFLGHLDQSTLFDLANFVLASKSSVKTICMNSVGYRTHRAVTGPIVGKFVLPGFWGTWLYQTTLFDLANTVLASKSSVETICMNSVGYRTHRAVTGPMSFKKSRRFLLPGFWGTWNQTTLFDLANTVLAIKSCRDHMHEFSGLQNPSSCHWSDEFQKIRVFQSFVGKPCSRVSGAPGCHPSTLIDIVHTALASKCSVKTICLISEGYRTHRAVTGPMSFKKSRRFVGNSCSRVFGAPGYIKPLYLTLKTVFWLVKGL